jgi:TPR repeat protein
MAIFSASLKRKQWTLGLLLVSLVFICLWWMEKHTPIQLQDNLTSSIHADTSATARRTEPRIAGRDENTAALSLTRDNSSEPGLTGHQKSWLIAHGYNVDGPNDDDVELVVLEANTQTQNLFDVMRFARALATRGDTRAKAWLEKSAALGSTEALIHLAYLSAMNVDGRASEQAAQEAAVWLSIARTRGDPHAEEFSKSLHIELNDEKFKAKSALAMEKIQAQRMSFGLSEFENEAFPRNDMP